MEQATIYEFYFSITCRVGGKTETTKDLTIWQRLSKLVLNPHEEKLQSMRDDED